MPSHDDAVEVDPPSDIDRVRVNFWLKRDLYQQILELASEDDIKVAPEIRQALKFYVRARKEGRT